MGFGRHVRSWWNLPRKIPTLDLDVVELSSSSAVCTARSKLELTSSVLREASWRPHVKAQQVGTSVSCFWMSFWMSFWMRFWMMFGDFGWCLVILDDVWWFWMIFGWFLGVSCCFEVLFTCDWDSIESDFIEAEIQYGQWKKTNVAEPSGKSWFYLTMGRTFSYL